MPIPYEKLTYNDILHHKAAYDCFDRAGKEMFSGWDIIEFEKAVLGCGDNHYLFMAEQIKKSSNVYNNLDNEMPFLRFRESGQHYGYELFLSPPPSWGSRGAPFYWAYVAREFTFDKLPMDEQYLYDKYRTIAKSFGLNINSCLHKYIEQFSAGGMSSGIVTEEFVRRGWYSIRNRNKLYSGQYKSVPDLYLDKVKLRLQRYASNNKFVNFEINLDFDSVMFEFALADCKANAHQKEVATTLWGIYNAKPLTIAEMALELGISKERVIQIEKRVLQHLLFGEENVLKENPQKRNI